MDGAFVLWSASNIDRVNSRPSYIPVHEADKPARDTRRAGGRGRIANDQGSSVGAPGFKPEA